MIIVYQNQIINMNLIDLIDGNHGQNLYFTKDGEQVFKAKFSNEDEKTAAMSKIVAAFNSGLPVVEIKYEGNDKPEVKTFKGL